MSVRDFTESMIFVFERSFAVGFCPSIQMYSAVFFAKELTSCLRCHKIAERPALKYGCRSDPACLSNDRGNDHSTSARRGSPRTRFATPGPPCLPRPDFFRAIWLD